MNRGSIEDTLLQAHAHGCIDPSRIDNSTECTLNYDPVCGCDNSTYSNACDAKRNGVLLWEAGECGEVKSLIQSNYHLASAINMQVLIPPPQVIAR